MPPIYDIVTSGGFLFAALLFAGYILLCLAMVSAAREYRDGELDPEAEQEEYEAAIEAGGEPGEVMGANLYLLARQAGAEGYERDGWRGVGFYMGIGFLAYLALYGGGYLFFTVLTGL